MTKKIEKEAIPYAIEFINEHYGLKGDNYIDIEKCMIFDLIEIKTEKYKTHILFYKREGYLPSGIIFCSLKLDNGEVSKTKMHLTKEEIEAMGKINVLAPTVLFSKS